MQGVDSASSSDSSSSGDEFDGVRGAFHGGGSAKFQQMNTGPAMNFTAIGCNNVIVGNNQDVTIRTFRDSSGGSKSETRVHSRSHGGKDFFHEPRAAGPPPGTYSAERRNVRPDGPSPKKSCYISYYADTEAERNAVLGLSDALRGLGIDSMVDIYVEDNPPESWPLWVEKEIADRDVTLLICSPRYYDLLTSSSSSHEHTRFHGTVMYSLLAGTSPRRFVPVFLGADNPPRKEFVPPSLQGTRMYHVAILPPDVGRPGHEAFTALYAFLSGQNRTPAPPVGDVVKLK
ncbi:uncharacterized protein [Oscarella lobularis]|uniref:uncharacterized protein isoform X2 n=1 Tax=Oscarella lobularis TaxID=121494 RepID=UPI003313C281